MELIKEMTTSGLLIQLKLCTSFGHSMTKEYRTNTRLNFDMELPCPAYTSYPTYNLETGLQKLAVSNMRQSSKTVRQARSTQTAVNATAMK